eukprot:364855-Chlamydomonas_euryale.AAC.6
MPPRPPQPLIAEPVRLPPPPPPTSAAAPRPPPASESARLRPPGDAKLADAAWSWARGAATTRAASRRRCACAAQSIKQATTWSILTPRTLRKEAGASRRSPPGASGLVCSLAVVRDERRRAGGGGRKPIWRGPLTPVSPHTSPGCSNRVHTGPVGGHGSRDRPTNRSSACSFPYSLSPHQALSPSSPLPIKPSPGTDPGSRSPFPSVDVLREALPLGKGSRLLFPGSSLDGVHTLPSPATVAEGSLAADHPKRVARRSRASCRRFKARIARPVARASPEA